MSRPAAPASLRKHGENPAYLIGRSFSFKTSSECREFKIISAVPARHRSVSVNINTSFAITAGSDPIKCPALKIVCGLVIDGQFTNVNPLPINFCRTYVWMASSSSAASPNRAYVRVPQMDAIFSGFHQPFISSKSHWGRGVKSNSRGVPTRLISTFSVSSRPIGASALGICGTRCNKSSSAASLSANSAISAAISLAISLLRAISGARSAAVGISRVILFFSAVFVCVIVFSSRTRASSARISSVLSSIFFNSQARFTISGFSRINLISNIFYPLCGFV